MKKIFLLLATCCLLLNSAFSQNIQWQNTIGGDGDDLLYSIQQTADGGYILGGTSWSNISGDKTENSIGGDDYWTVKTDSVGTIQWQNTIGGSNSDELFSVQQTADGGYILGGSSFSNISGDKTENSKGGWDYWLVHINSTGSIDWQKTIGGSNTDWLNSIQQTNDGGYILGGSSDSNISGDKTESTCNNSEDYWIVKIDSQGNIEWQNTIGGNDHDVFYSIQQTADGGYILGGTSKSDISCDKTENCMSFSDYWIVKTDVMGNIQWENTIGGNNSDDLYSIRQTTDGGYILGGGSSSYISGDKTENCIGVYDYWIVKTDSLGNIQWQNTIGGTDVDRLFSVNQTSDGGYILGGFSYSSISGDKTENNWDPTLGTMDYWIVKTDSNGNIQWQNTIGGSNIDWLNSIKQTSDGGYILAGLSQSNISGDKTENCIGAIGLPDYWIVKINDTTLTTNTQTTIQNPQSAITIFPNPANEYSVISFQFGVGDEIRITDVLGNTLFTKTIAGKCSMFNVQCSMLARGMYFVTVSGEKGSITRKLVKE